MTGRKELDWTSPDWNKPLLPSLLFTTPTSPPASLPPTFIQGRIAGKCSILRAKNPAARVEAEEVGQHSPFPPLPATHHHPGDPATRLAGRVGRANPLYWTPHGVFVQGSCIRLGLHNQILLGHRRLLQRSETQRFSCLLAHVGCAGFLHHRRCTSERLKRRFKLTYFPLHHNRGLPSRRIFLDSERAQTADWKRPAVLPSNEP